MTYEHGLQIALDHCRELLMAKEAVIKDQQFKIAKLREQLENLKPKDKSEAAPPKFKGQQECRVWATINFSDL